MSMANNKEKSINELNELNKNALDEVTSRSGIQDSGSEEQNGCTSDIGSPVSTN